MSTYWQLKCITCNKTNEQEINHGEARILELLEKKAIIKSFYDAEFTYLSFSYDYEEWDFALFIYEHYEHNLVAVNEYGKQLNQAQLEIEVNRQVEARLNNK